MEFKDKIESQEDKVALKKKLDLSSLIVGWTILGLLGVSFLVSIIVLMYWRVNTKLDLAERELRAGQFQSARALVDHSIFAALARTRWERIKAQTLKNSDPEKALKIMLSVVEREGLKNASFTDLHSILELGLLSFEFDDAIPVLKELKMRQPLSTDLSVFEGWILLGKNKPLAALGHLRIAMAEEPYNALGNLLRGQIFLSSNSNIDVARGCRALLLAAEDDGVAGLAALRLLTSREELVLVDSERAFIASRLGEHPLANPGDRESAIVWKTADRRVAVQ